MMTAAQLKTKRNLETTLSINAGFDVEITIRGLKEFTLTAEGCRDWTRLLMWFASSKGYKMVSHNEVYDAECDCSFLYFTVA